MGSIGTNGVRARVRAHRFERKHIVLQILILAAFLSVQILQTFALEQYGFPTRLYSDAFDSVPSQVYAVALELNVRLIKRGANATVRDTFDTNQGNTFSEKPC